MVSMYVNFSYVSDEAVLFLRVIFSNYPAVACRDSYVYKQNKYALSTHVFYLHSVANAREQSY